MCNGESKCLLNMAGTPKGLALIPAVFVCFCCRAHICLKDKTIVGKMQKLRTKETCSKFEICTVAIGFACETRPHEFVGLLYLEGW